MHVSEVKELWLCPWVCCGCSQMQLHTGWIYWMLGNQHHEQLVFHLTIEEYNMVLNQGHPCHVFTQQACNTELRTTFPVHFLLQNPSSFISRVFTCLQHTVPCLLSMNFFLFNTNVFCFGFQHLHLLFRQPLPTMVQDKSTQMPLQMQV